MQRSLAARDGAQALSDIKCLVESIARVVLQIDGTPADPAEAFKTTVGRACGLLKGQPGHELANDSVFAERTVAGFPKPFAHSWLRKKFFRLTYIDVRRTDSPFRRRNRGRHAYR